MYRIFGKLHPGADPGQGNLPKIGQSGVPSGLLLQIGRLRINLYGSDLKAYGKKRYYFWFHSKVNFFKRLLGRVFLDFVI